MGSGWNDVRLAFSAPGGIIYAITHNGDPFWTETRTATERPDGRRDPGADAIWAMADAIGAGMAHIPTSLGVGLQGPRL